MAIHTVDNLSRNTTGQPLEAKSNHSIGSAAIHSALAGGCFAR